MVNDEKRASATSRFRRDDRGRTMSFRLVRRPRDAKRSDSPEKRVTRLASNAGGSNNGGWRVRFFSFFSLLPGSARVSLRSGWLNAGIDSDIPPARNARALPSMNWRREER